MPFNAQDLMPILYIGFSLFAPLIPAVAIYKVLPVSPTEVAGPFQGLQIKLGGAFAGYFLLVLISVTFIQMSPKAPNYEVWEIQGKLRLNPSAEIDSQRHPISIIPPFARVSADGSFDVFVAVPRKHNGELDFPVLSVNYGKEYGKVDVPLRDLATSNKAEVRTDGAHSIVLESNTAAKKIKLDGEVVLTRSKKASDNEGYLEDKNDNDVVEPVQIKLDRAEGQP